MASTTHESLNNLSTSTIVSDAAPFVTPMRSILRQTSTQHAAKATLHPIQPTISSNELLTQVQRLLPKGTSKRNVLLKWAQIKIHKVDCEINQSILSSDRFEHRRHELQQLVE